MKSKENESVKVINKIHDVQQKIVVKVQMKCEKCRTKAMKIAATESGVSSVQISGEWKDRVEVVGDNTDSVSLTRSLRKKVGCATLLSVEEVKETTKGKPKDPTPDKPSISPSPPLSCITPCPQLVVCCDIPHDPSPDFCSIL